MTTTRFQRLRHRWFIWINFKPHGWQSSPGPARNPGGEVRDMDYRKLYEKHARSLRQRGWIAIGGGVLNIVAGILLLKRLRDERQQ
jgi:hypothetical protein